MTPEPMCASGAGAVPCPAGSSLGDLSVSYVSALLAEYGVGLFGALFLVLLAAGVLVGYHLTGGAS